MKFAERKLDWSVVSDEFFMIIPFDHDSDMEDRLAEGFFLLASNPQ